MRRSFALTLALLTLIGANAGCKKKSSHIEITYDLTALDISKVERIETQIHVAAGDGRAFTDELPYRQVAPGVGYEVTDTDGDGVREVIILHEAALGFVFSPTFTFNLLPPASELPPALTISAKAFGPSATLGEAPELGATYGTHGAVTMAIQSTLCGTLSCDADQTCCAEQCVGTDADPLNCGMCGTACGDNSDSCLGGVCRCNGGAACTAGSTCCTGEGCLNLTNDPFNCGACGHPCNSGESCVNSECRCGASVACDDGVVCCVLDGTGTCSPSGSCACGGNNCTNGSVCCNAAQGLCEDLMNDNNNCGACGTTCGAGLQCQNGSCRCAGQICAAGDTCCADGCHTITDDPMNCGGCNIRCLAGELCVDSVCKCGGTGATCMGAKSCCGTTCVLEQVDAHNCGGCNLACQVGEDCKAGACSCNGGLACATGNACCTNANGGCVDLKSNPQNCGGCNNACPMGSSCISGSCVVTACAPQCAVNSNQCVSGVCACPGEAMATACVGSDTCCTTGCTDVTKDAMNCGKCDNACSKDQKCCNSQCVGLAKPCLMSTSCNGSICPSGFMCCQTCGSGGTTQAAGTGGPGGGLGSACVAVGDMGACPPIENCPL